MSLTELVKTAEVVVDSEGNEPVVLDRSIWEEIVATLEKLTTLPDRVEAVHGKYAFVPTSSEDFARRKQEEIEREG